ncbi:MAG: PAC2 family protein [Candidatus Parvarchaeota archaeon]|nr:PAC2 family protein [Candidatus Parvarchaeota archaeon]
MSGKINIDSRIEPGHYIVTAFPTAGLASLLAVNYLIQKGILKKVGHINLNGLNQVAIIENRHLNYPIRLFEGKDSVFITSQIPIPVTHVDELTGAVFELYKTIKAKGIISMDAMETAEEKNKSEVYFVSEGFDNKIKDAKELEEGAMIGVNASIGLMAKETKTPFLGLMAETHMGVPDGLAAASLINSLGNIIDVHVDTTELINEYKRIGDKLNNLITKTNQSKNLKEETYG